MVWSKDGDVTFAGKVTAGLVESNGTLPQGKACLDHLTKDKGNKAKQSTCITPQAWITQFNLQRTPRLP